MPMVIALDGSPDWCVLGAAVAFAMVSTLAFGLWPAIGLARTDVQGQLRAGTSRPPLVRLTARNLLVVSQLALSLVLLAAAGIFIKGARNAADADPGYPLDRGLVVTIDATAGGDPGSRACDRARDLLERVRRMPGVQSASLASSIAFGVALQGRRVRRADAPAAEARYAVFTVAGAQYFDTLGIPVLRGREFADAEERGISAGRGVIVNEPLARALWPDGDPVGQRVQFSAGDASAWDDPREVVGVVRGVRQSLFDTMPVPQAFVPLAGAPLGGDLYLHLRPSHGGSAEALMLQRVRQELRDAYPTLPVLSVLTLGQHRDRSIYLWMARAGAQLFTLLGLAALALAALGVYGVKAFLVAQRTREIGIRVALGATRADIVRLVIADGLGWTGAALCAGLAIAVAVSRVLASWVYGVGTIEPATLTLTVAILMATSLLACYLPARRSTALPPIIALRQE
jgi:predicted permease